ncbi:MAG: hypothetical protein ACREP7_14630, partial [Lysobacter sp.]
MPDRSLTPPQTWADAFAQLPQDTPPADGWSRMAATLAAQRGETSSADTAAASADRSRGATDRGTVVRPRRATAQRWAIAAMLAAALPLGLWLGLRAQRPTLESNSPDPIAQHAAPSVPMGDAAIPPATTDNGRPATVAAANVASANPERAALAATDPKRVPSNAPAATPNAVRGADSGRNQSRRIAAAREPKRPDSERSAANSAESQIPTATGSAASLASAANPSQTTDPLLQLQAESAQLEALVALTRDDRVASASAAVMSSDLDQRLRLIDAALIDGTLPTDQRVSLWRQRVGALRA